MSLNQVDNAVGHAAAFGVQQDALLVVQLADHEQLVPPVCRQARKACARSDQSIDGIEIGCVPWSGVKAEACDLIGDQ